MLPPVRRDVRRIPSTNGSDWPNIRSTILGAIPENSEETNDSSVRNASLSPGAYIQRYL